MAKYVRLLIFCGLLLVHVATTHSHSTIQGPAVDPLPKGAIARLGAPRSELRGGVKAPVFTPDGKTIVAFGPSKHWSTVRFFETATGKELSQFEVGIEDVRNVILTPDGKGVFLCHEWAVRLHDRSNGELIRRFFVERPHASCALSPDGKWLAVPSNFMGGG
jgi:hypothetical protein